MKCIFPLLLCARLFAAEVLFVATPFTDIHSFTPEIEGPACDKAGNVYAVSFARKPTIGRVNPTAAVRCSSTCP